MRDVIPAIGFLYVAAGGVLMTYGAVSGSTSAVDTSMALAFSGTLVLCAGLYRRSASFAEVERRRDERARKSVEEAWAATSNFPDTLVDYKTLVDYVNRTATAVGRDTFDDDVATVAKARVEEHRGR